MSNDFISAAIVTYNNGTDAKKACESLLKHTQRYPLKLYVFDNASSDNTVELVRSIPGVTVMEGNKNIGFGAAHNLILQQEMGWIHFVVNPDIVIQSDVLSDLSDLFSRRQDIAMAMPKILNQDGSEQFLPKEVPTFRRLYLGRLAPLGGRFRRIREEFVWQNKAVSDITDIDFCSGCFFGIREEAFRSLGGFDERFFMYLEDVDLTLRCKRIGRVVMVPEVSVTHLWKRESARSVKYLFIHVVSSLKFMFKWRKRNR